MTPRARAAILAAAGLAAAALPSTAAAQIFLASGPHPEFSVGPVFVIANVRPDRTVTVNLSFSLTLRPGTRPDGIRQALFLLWPAEVTGPTAAGPADPALAREIEGRGFAVQAGGRLALRSRDRTLIGTPALGTVLPQAASYVTVSRREPFASQLGPISYVKIPWTPKLADPLTVMTLVLPLRGLVTPKAATWIAEAFWGPRWVLSVGFGDLGPPAMPLYPLYFERRDRVVRLAREFSIVTANFSDADHLLIDAVEPAAATRRRSLVRTGNEIVTMVLAPSEGITPQTVKVQFSYFSGRIAWRPILVSLALLLLGNVAGALMFGREMFQVIRARRRARRTARPDGFPTRETLEALVAGGVAHDAIVARWGPPDVDEEMVAPSGARTLLYRRALDGRVEEVEISLDADRVRAVRRRTVRAHPA